jgi:hypothetical protein
LNDNVLGYIILIGSLVGITCCFYLIFLSPWVPPVVQILALLAVAAILAIMAWIGYILARASREALRFLGLTACLEIVSIGAQSFWQQR